MATHVHDGTIDDPVGALGLWAEIGRFTPADSHQSMLMDKSYDQLQLIGQDRSLRFMYGNEDFPSVVWLVIYAGLLITVSFSYFFGLETFPSQALMCGIFSSLLGLTILAILELAHPYQGAVISLRRAVPFRDHTDGRDGQARHVSRGQPERIRPVRKSRDITIIPRQAVNTCLRLTVRTPRLRRGSPSAGETGAGQKFASRAASGVHLQLLASAAPSRPCASRFRHRPDGAPARTRQ